MLDTNSSTTIDFGCPTNNNKFLLLWSLVWMRPTNNSIIVPTQHYCCAISSTSVIVLFHSTSNLGAIKSQFDFIYIVGSARFYFLSTPLNSAFALNPWGKKKILLYLLQILMCVYTYIYICICIYCVYIIWYHFER